MMSIFSIIFGLCFLFSNAVCAAYVPYKAPTIQKFTTSGAGTYTTPKGVKRIQVIAIGGGGGGGGAQTGGGSGGGGGNGVATTFGANISAGGGGGGAGATSGGVGNPGTPGIATLSGGLVGITMDGSHGFSPPTILASGYIPGSPGARGPLGGGGGMPYYNDLPTANSGSGGGGGQTQAVSGYAGSSGGSAAYIDVDINNPASSYSYVVGAGGALGVGAISGNSGQDGANGILIVKEFYQ